MHEAAKSAYYGLTDAQALATLTTNPAEVIRLENRIGSLKVGLDADFAVWDRYPLEIGAQTSQVYVEGAKLVDVSRTILPKTTVTQALLSLTGVCAPDNAAAKQYLSCYSIEGASVYTLDGVDDPIEVNIVVENGLITCLNCTAPQSCGLIEFPGGIVVPGFVQVGTWLGLVEGMISHFPPPPFL